MQRSARGWQGWITLVMLWIGGGVLPAVAGEPAPPHETLRIASAAMSEVRRVNVYLPPDYDARRDAAYPVLYMPDGGEQEDFPHVASAVDSLVRAGDLRPMLVVGIENTERRRDMTGPTEVEDDRKIAPRVGGSAAFRRFIASELMPVVRARYRVNDEAAIIGESAVGLFIVETFFLQPDLFDTYIALDPSLWWNAQQWPREAAARLRAAPGVQARLYLASGNAESNGPQTARLAEALRAHAGPALRWEYEPRPDLRHDNIYRILERPVLRKLFPAGGSPAPGEAGRKPLPD